VRRRAGRDGPEILATPAVAEHLRALDLQSRPNTPEQFADFFRGQSARRNSFIQEAGIRLE
jgi:tripartite-type tricarboxylate transporter receptor subunit TctC